MLSRKLTPVSTVLSLFLALATSTTSWAVCAPRPGDTVLLVSSRSIGCSTSVERLATGLRGWQLDASGSWIATEPVEQLSTLNPALPTVFYIHGNQITSSAARSRGLAVYRRLTRTAAEGENLQFVLFSWQSDKVRGLLRDYREKAARTRPVAKQLAWIVNRLPEGAPVGLLGYSYGARVSSGAAHLLAGGTLGGLRLDEPGIDRPMRAVFLAAAEDASWLAPNRYHGLAMARIESLLVTTNPQDPAMRFYHFVSRNGRPRALGERGPMGLDTATSSRIAVQRVQCSVGSSHDLYRYIAVPGLMERAWQRLSFREAHQVASEPEADTLLLGGIADPSPAALSATGKAGDIR